MIKFQIAMKKINEFVFRGILGITLLLGLGGCQSEFEEVSDQSGPTTDAISANSSTAVLIEKTVSNHGSFDNIVDGSSCMGINFPYTVTVNGLQLQVDSRDDIAVIKEIFEAVDDDDDLLEIIFPITITLSDYTEVTINGLSDLRALAKECSDRGDDDDIECIDFVYPMTVYTFDTDAVETGRVIVNSDKEMRIFMSGMLSTALLGFDFPLTMELYDGSKIQVGSNAELAQAIENARDTCDDDDNEYGHDDFDKGRFDALLVKCPWSLVDMYRYDADQMGQYAGYLFSYDANGSVLAKDNMGNVFLGTWESYDSASGIKLKMQFEGLVDFTIDWDVYEVDEGRIKLYDNGSKIIMKSSCGIFGGDSTVVSNQLKECVWVVKELQIGDSDDKAYFGSEFDFLENDQLTLNTGSTVYQGTWSLSQNNQGRLVLMLAVEDGTTPAMELPLTDLGPSRMKFENGDDGELVIQRDCGGQDDEDVVAINRMLSEGVWLVARFDEDGVSQTQDFEGYSFQFGAEHIATATIAGSGNGIAGNWRVLRDGDGHLRFYMNLGPESPLDELRDDWRIVSVTETRIEIKSLNDDGIDILVFERP